MKKLVAWAKANPFLATITGIAIVAILILIGRAIFKSNTPETPQEPTNPNPNERSGILWQYPTSVPTIITGGGRPRGFGGSGMTGGVGGGARVSSGKS